MRAGLRRIALTTAVVLGATLVVSLLAGLVAGNVRHAIATGCYVVGCALLIAGILAGLRTPFRPESGAPAPTVEPGPSGIVPRGRRARRATGDEQHDTVAVSVLLVGLGLALVVVGVATDATAALV